MAGIVGVVGGVDERAFSHSLESLVHRSGIEARVFHHGARWALGAVCRTNAVTDDAFDAAAATGVVVYGTPQDVTTGNAVDAEAILRRYLADGRRSLTGFDGAFVVAVFDAPGSEILVVNDRMATLPMVVARRPGRCAFAPEAKAVLMALGEAPRLDATAGLEFLGLGFAIGSRTLFEGVSLLPPAHLLRISLDDAAVELGPYWDLSFRPERAFRDSVAASDALFEVLASSVSHAVDAASSSPDLLLTGGYDSRTLLALMVLAGKAPARTMSWGIDDAIPASDPFVAKRIAAQFDVPFAFLRYDHRTFADRAAAWAFVSELGSDNLGNFAAGPDALYELGDPALVVWNGDQMLGTGGVPSSVDDAVEVATGVPMHGLPPGLEGLVKPALRGEAAHRIRAGVLGLVGSRTQEPPKDVLDYLGWQVRVARWLNAPTFFREPMVSTGRPMLHAPVVDLFSRLPANQRVDKRLLVTMLQRRLPEVLREPVVTANSLVDWHRAFTSAPKTSDFFRALASEPRILESPIGPLLDEAGWTAARKAYGDTRFAPMRRTAAPASRVVQFRRAMARWGFTSTVSRAAQRSARWVLGRRTGASSGRVIQRLALLNLLLRTIDEGWFASRGPGQRSNGGVTGHAPWAVRSLAAGQTEVAAQPDAEV